MNTSSGLVAWVGTYASTTNTSLVGGVHVFSVSADGLTSTALQHVTEPSEAGYLRFAEEVSTLYVVNEVKTDGRGPVSPPAALHAFAVDPATGELSVRNSVLCPGPFPSFLDYSPKHNAVFGSNHGGFEHIERVVRDGAGGWTTEYAYDDSTVIQYRLTDNGTIDGLQDVQILSGHGTDPNSSPQQGGHAQASAHAHSTSVDPSENFLVVGDKGTDQVHVYALGGEALELVYQFNASAVTAPRHVAWASVDNTTEEEEYRFYMSFELSSQIVSFNLNATTGAITQLDAISTVADNSTVYNEPAEIQVHPTNNQFVYVNNRGEDTVAWFHADETTGALTRVGAVQLTTSLNAGVAARSFRFSPSGELLFVADRPQNAIRVYSVDGETGDLKEISHIPVSEPAFVVVAEL